MRHAGTGRTRGERGMRSALCDSNPYPHTAMERGPHTHGEARRTGPNTQDDVLLVADAFIHSSLEWPRHTACLFCAAFHLREAFAHSSPGIPPSAHTNTEQHSERLECGPEHSRPRQNDAVGRRRLEMEARSGVEQPRCITWTNPRCNPIPPPSSSDRTLSSRVRMSRCCSRYFPRGRYATPFNLVMLSLARALHRRGDRWDGARWVVGRRGRE